MGSKKQYRDDAANLGRASAAGSVVSWYKQRCRRNPLRRPLWCCPHSTAHPPGEEHSEDWDASLSFHLLWLWDTQIGSEMKLKGKRSKVDTFSLLKQSWHQSNNRKVGESSPIRFLFDVVSFFQALRPFLWASVSLEGFGETKEERASIT